MNQITAVANKASAPPQKLYAVSATGRPLPRGWPHRNIIFHGVNKSGSLAMAEVMRGAYFAAGRANKCFCTYFEMPKLSNDYDSRLIDIAMASVPDGSLFIGHYLYGAVDVARAGALMVSQIRHPLPRFLSIYHWLAKRHGKIKSRGSDYPTGEFPSLEKFIASSRGRAQVAQFSVGFGAGWQKRIRSMSAEQMYEQAMLNLETSIDWFGLAEYFEESIFALAAICGIPAVPVWRRDDRNAGRVMAWDIPASTRELIEHHHAAEFAFYARAKALFLERISRITFGAELDAYRQACAAEYKDKLLDIDGTEAQAIPEPVGTA